MGRIQRRVRETFSDGNFAEAMEATDQAEALAEDIYGNEHPVYASCVNNRGLIQKSLGSYEDAVESFEKAASIYYHSVGSEHRSTATTFHNLALCYKAVADASSGMKRLEYLHQANITFEDALKACEASHGKDHPTTALTASGLGSVVRDLAPKGEEDGSAKRRESELRRAEDLHSRAFASLEKSNRTADSLAMATVANNYAFHLKQTECESRYADAEDLYKRAVDIRTRRLTACHPDTIAARGNLAELYISMDREEESQALQLDIISDLEDMGISVSPDASSD